MAASAWQPRSARGPIDTALMFPLTSPACLRTARMKANALNLVVVITYWLLTKLERQFLFDSP